MTNFNFELLKLARVEMDNNPLILSVVSRTVHNVIICLNVYVATCASMTSHMRSRSLSRRVSDLIDSGFPFFRFVYALAVSLSPLIPSAELLQATLPA